FFANKNATDNKNNQATPIQQQAIAASDAATSFPKLASVDQQRQLAAARGKGLVADVEGRRYAPVITRQGLAVNALNAAPPKPPVITAAAALAPAAQPKIPVLTARSSNLTVPVQPTSLPSLSSTGVSGQDSFQARFARRLAEIKAQAAKGIQFAQSNTLVSNTSVIETVVVSPSGIKAGYGTQVPQLAQAVVQVNGQLSYVAQPMSPLSANTVHVATIRFENGSSKLSTRDRQILANVIRLKKERGGRIRVVGHASSRTRNTDPVKHKMINFRVSVARADVIAKTLIRMGADRAQLQIDAISDSSPEFLEVMPTGEAGNRRAEIYLES
ncbi:MAG: OmpA family protein, partial [Rhodospirillales bacterium]